MGKVHFGSSSLCEVDEGTRSVGYRLRNTGCVHAGNRTIVRSNHVNCVDKSKHGKPNQHRRGYNGKKH